MTATIFANNSKKTLGSLRKFSDCSTAEEPFLTPMYNCLCRDMADFEIADGNKQLECVVTVPCLLRRSSGKLEIQVESDDTPEQPMTPLKAAILQAHQGMALLTSGKAATMNEIAEKLKMDRSYLGRTLKLANLAPDIVKLIWEKRQPETLTLDNLRKGIPESWEEQRRLFLP